MEGAESVWVFGQGELHVRAERIRPGGLDLSGPGIGPSAFVSLTGVEANYSGMGFKNWSVRGSIARIKEGKLVFHQKSVVTYPNGRTARRSLVKIDLGSAKIWAR
jgi:hypothetical protein